MANEEQLAILRQGVDVWNRWRTENPDVDFIDLSSSNLAFIDLQYINFKNTNLTNVDLIKTNLQFANLSEANLTHSNLDQAILLEAQLMGADLSYTVLTNANLRAASLKSASLIHANLTAAIVELANGEKANFFGACLDRARFEGAQFREANFTNATLCNTDLTHTDLQSASFENAQLKNANLTYAKFNRANLRNTNLSYSNLNFVDFSESDLRGTELIGASLINTCVAKAKISGSSVYGINIWDLEGEFEEQKDLIIESKSAQPITVDNIKVAQFIYLILNNAEIRGVINTLTSKSVLILGRFALPERKEILDALRNKLREYNLLPIVFDFDRPADKDFTETIKTLAGISYFVIADVTNPKSSPLELQATVPDYQIPFVPIIQEGESPFAMMVDLQKKYPWVLPTRSYDSIETLMSALKPGIIDPAVEMRNKLRLVKAQEQETESLRDYVKKSI